ncbi:HypC/HybG/HupF family hydrogenase formation chaperone [Raoultibacter massiliensis]|uniref:HypC/HybG/HupF family hydrogenase formation chaperone n=1 Tax=Raoultibacter massiliensis TaxID=1852371 RepID=UPI003A8FF93F
MCLAIPAKITEFKDDRMATVDILGVTRDISLDLTPQANIGDFVLVHAGFAIEVVDEQYAQETIDLIKQFPELAMDDVPQGASPASAPLGSLGL